MRKLNLAIYLASVAIVLFAINASARSWLAAPPRGFVSRDPRVVILKKDVTKIPEPEKGTKNLLLMGSSHIYGLPGLEPSDPLREESDKTMLFEIADQFPGKNLRFYRLAYPNFFAFEMLSCLENLRRAGHHFDTVVFGVTWENLARGHESRFAVQQLFRNKAFADYMRAQLSDPAVAAAPEVLAAIDAAEVKVRKDAEKEALQAHADAVENDLNNWLQDKFFLLGHADALRARIFRLFAIRAQSFFIQQIGEESYRYGVVQSDLDFNLKCMSALLHIFAQDKSRVLIYLPPERPDLPSMIDVSNKDHVLQQLIDEARQLGFTVVDASDVVPVQNWGWADGLQDRAHFLEPGHVLLAEFLLKEGEKHKSFAPLKTPAAGSN